MPRIKFLLFRNDQITATRGRAAAISHARHHGLFARLAKLGGITSAERVVCPALG